MYARVYYYNTRYSVDAFGKHELFFLFRVSCPRTLEDWSTSRNIIRILYIILKRSFFFSPRYKQYELLFYIRDKCGYYSSTVLENDKIRTENDKYFRYFLNIVKNPANVCCIHTTCILYIYIRVYATPTSVYK